MRLVKCGVNEALQALTYEMVHLYQHHFGDPGRGRYYNKGYRGDTLGHGWSLAYRGSRALSNDLWRATPAFHRPGDVVPSTGAGRTEYGNRHSL